MQAFERTTGLVRGAGEDSGPLGLATVDGLSPAHLDGVERITIVGDDGNRDAKRSAGDLLLDAGLLKIEDW